MYYYNGIIILAIMIHQAFPSYNDYYSSLEKRLTEQNPMIVMSRYRSLSARAGQLGNFLLPDMSAEYMMMQNGFEVTLSQMIPFPGKIYAKSRQLNHYYKGARDEHRMIQAQIRAEFKFYYLNLYYLDRTVKILNDHLSIITQLESQIESQVAAGKVPVSRLLAIQIEREKLADRIQRTQTQYKNLVTSVMSLFDDKPDRNTLDKSVTDTRISEKEIVISDTHRPGLVKESALYLKKVNEKEQARYMKQFKYYKFLPDMMLESSYRKMDDAMAGSTDSGQFRDNFQVMFSLQVPLTVFKRSGELAEAGNMYRARKTAVKEVYNMIDKNLSIAAENHSMNRKSYLTYKTTLKQTADQNFLEVQSRYITAKNVSAVDFLEAFRKLLDIDLMILGYQVEMEKNVIMIEKITTKDVDDLIGVSGK